MEVDWIALGGLAFTALSIILGGRKWVESKVKDEKRDREGQVAVALAEAKLANERLTDLRIHVADTYATKEIVEQANERVMCAINDLGKSIDKRLDRVDTRLDRAIDDRPNIRSRTD